MNIFQCQIVHCNAPYVPLSQPPRTTRSDKDRLQAVEVDKLASLSNKTQATNVKGKREIIHKDKIEDMTFTNPEKRYKTHRYNHS